MSEPRTAAAPESGPELPTFAELAADPEIGPLLDFEPAPRKVERPDGWTPELQRELVARIALTGSPGRAVDQMDKNLSGAKHLYRGEDAESFRAAWKAAIALAAERKRLARAAAPPRPVDVPGVTRQRKWERAPDGPANDHDTEDEDSVHRLADEARDSISRKLLAARRLYLREISGSAGMRAAFEILTELPVDWDKAERLEPQPDEPFTRVSLRSPDMLLTAENGWLGDYAHGPDKKAQLRRDIDAYRAEEGLEPVQWDEDEGDDR